MALEEKQQNERLVAPTSSRWRGFTYGKKLEETKHDQTKESYEWRSIFLSGEKDGRVHHAFRAIHSTKSVEINAHAGKKRYVNQTQWRAHRKLCGNQYNAVELRKGKAITSIHCREKCETL